jgi:hypothetical protein
VLWFGIIICPSWYNEWFVGLFSSGPKTDYGLVPPWPGACHGLEPPQPDLSLPCAAVTTGFVTALCRRLAAMPSPLGDTNRVAWLLAEHDVRLRVFTRAPV